MQFLKCFPVVIGTALLAGSASVSIAAQSERVKYNFNSDWKVMVGDPTGADAPGFDDTSWKSVTVPYAWNEDSAFKVKINSLPTGIAWYRKHFKLRPDDTGKKVFLEFEGIRHGGEFTLNGKPIGMSENGVMAFGFDVTDVIKAAPQENVLAARIDNSYKYQEKATGTVFQWNHSSFYANYGGINKNVILHVTDKLYQTLPLYSNLGTSGVYVYAKDFDIPGKSATITAESQVKNDYRETKKFTYEVTIADMDGKIVNMIDGGQQTIKPGETKIIKASAKVIGLNFWSWGYGYLYNVTTVLKVDGQPIDSVTTRTGFRKTEFDHGMVRLNDRALQMKGYAQRSTNEWPALGLSVPAWVSDFSNKMMVDDNANLVRWMHVTPWKQDIESFDRVGLIESLPAGDSERDVTGRQWDQRVELMRDAIIYNRNNPSILFYESGNKGVIDKHLQQMIDLRDKWDPNGGRVVGSRDMQGSKKAEYGGEMLYINKSATKPMWSMEYSRDEALRKWWDAFTPPYHNIPRTNAFIKPTKAMPESKIPPSYDYNQNQDTQATENVARWYDYWRERPGTGERVNDGGVKIIFSDSNTHMRGVQNYRRSGAVDPMRLPKDSYYADQVMWNGWVDIEHPGIYIIGHWNYEPNVKKDISVVSSADKVELFVNGTSLGFGTQSSRFLYTFKDVAWQSGTIKAIGYDANGKTLCETEKRTAGEPAAIKLTPIVGPSGLIANGADLALVDVEVVDAQGNRCPTALNTVDFALSGPAEWRGGIAQDDKRSDNYILSTSLPVQCGVNRVIVRADTTPGKITLAATSGNLKSATVDLVSKPFESVDGLSTQWPTDGLPSDLERGPTPTTPAYVVTRIPVHIAKVTSGANSNKASASYDDDETTSWANDGKLSTAWIQYQFDRPATVSEVTMKMGGWRSRSYPIKITIDGKVAYTGTTPRSLGYVTMTFPPTSGTSMKVEMTGATSDKDAFGDIVEVTGKKDTDTDPTPTVDAKGALNIVEIEIYSPVGHN